MKILVIPRITNVGDTTRSIQEIYEMISIVSPTLAIARLDSYSIFTPPSEIKESSIGLLSAGYSALERMETFRSYDVYIGYLLKEDFPKIDAIIYEDQVAYEIFKARFNSDSLLPNANEVVICDSWRDVANEVYRRTVIRNFGA